MMPAINYLAVILSGLIYTGLGGVWYSSDLFGVSWKKLTETSKEQIERSKKRGMAVNVIINAIGCFVLAFTVAIFVGFIKPVTVADGAIIGFWIWLGFIATTMLNPVLWEGKSWKYYSFNLGYQFISLLTISIIITVWP